MALPAFPKGPEEERFAQQAEDIYRKRYQRRLEPGKKGKIVAIEVESGEVLLGASTLEAGMKAREKYPDKVFYFIRVGYPTVYKTRGITVIFRSRQGGFTFKAF